MLILPASPPCPEWNGVCACGKAAADGARCRLGATHAAPTDRQVALEAVADDWAQLGRDIRSEDTYASHVTETQKDANLLEHLATAERIRRGEEHGFWLEQRVHEKLTGECIALLPAVRKILPPLPY